MPGPLLDRPEGWPRWLPSIDDERSTSRLMLAIVIVLIAGVLGFCVRGADRPADPILGAPPGSTIDLVPIPGFDEVAIRITAPDGTVVGYCVLHASTPEQRQRGLMTLTDLKGYPGMLFSYDEDTQNGFYMRNTPLPLSIAWIAADGAVVSTADMAPCADVDGCPGYAPAGPYRYAFEVPQGQLPDFGVATGAKIEVTGACV